MSPFPARRRLLAAAVASSSITDLTRRPVSPLEQLYRSVPWILLVGIGALGGWRADQVQGLILLLAPIVLFGVLPARRG